MSVNEKIMKLRIFRKDMHLHQNNMMEQVQPGNLAE